MIYADANASLPLLEPVKEYLTHRLSHGPLGNPNALHYVGKNLIEGIKKCRELCALELGATPEQVIFNSGATEGIVTIFHHHLKGGPKEGKKIIYVSPIEHHSVLNTCDYYQDKGYEVKYIPMLQKGVIDWDQFQIQFEELKNQIAFLGLMAANNETGVLQPFIPVGQLCQKYSIPFLCDTAQFIGKEDFSFNELPIGYALLSSHKCGALPGSGILLIKETKNFTPLIHGAGQENHLRGGTQNYLAIETLALALKEGMKQLKEKEKVQKQKELFEKSLKEKVPNTYIAGEESSRLCNTTYAAFPGIMGQALQIELESKDILVTTTAACSDNHPLPSHVLSAMGEEYSLSRAAIRISTRLEKQGQEYPQILEALIKSIQKLQRIQSY